MDTRAANRALIERILTEYTVVPYSYGEVDLQTVFDREGDHYLVMLVGRDGIRRVHGCLIHVDLIGDKFWIQRDGTEYGIARELVDAGIPKEQIVLAFHLAEDRPFTGYAVA
ncbi:MAG: XisI protein [Thermomicrobiales bacterium]